MRMLQTLCFTAVLLGATTFTTPIRAGVSSLDQEAEAGARKYLRTIFTQCGDDYFSKQVIPQQPNVFARDKTARKSVPEVYTIEQYHQFTTSITPKPLTTADTLNGIECSPRHEILYTGAHGSRPYPASITSKRSNCGGGEPRGMRRLHDFAR
jgi:hypothetical protein